MYLRATLTDEAFPAFARALKMKRSKKRLAPGDILTPDEVRAMFDAAGYKRDRALIACLWETGVRVHELLALDVGSVAWAPSPENGGREIATLWFGKVKGDGDAHEGLIASGAAALRAYMTERGGSATDPLFVGARGNRLTPNGTWFMVKAAKRRAGITKRVHPHLFRHSRATFLQSVDVPDGKIKQMLGWKPGSNVLGETYSHLRNADVRAAHLKAEGFAVLETARPVAPSFALEGLPNVVAVPMSPVGERRLVYTGIPEDQVEPIAAALNALIADPAFMAEIQAAIAKRLTLPP
jgi:site-specific recombinase XerD